MKRRIILNRFLCLKMLLSNVVRNLMSNSWMRMMQADRQGRQQVQIFHFNDYVIAFGCAIEWEWNQNPKLRRTALEGDSRPKSG